MQFSFEDSQYDKFIADWAKMLQSIPSVVSVYYVGSSAWIPASAYARNSIRMVPNFVVCTNDPKWESQDGSLWCGSANHDIIFSIDDDMIEQFYALWRHTGWMPRSIVFKERATTQAPESYIRVIEVPADSSWAGPRYLGHIKNGLSFDDSYTASLRAYDSETGLMDLPVYFWSTQENPSIK